MRKIRKKNIGELSPQAILSSAPNPSTNCVDLCETESNDIEHTRGAIYREITSKPIIYNSLILLSKQARRPSLVDCLVSECVSADKNTIRTGGIFYFCHRVRPICTVGVVEPVVPTLDRKCPNRRLGHVALDVRGPGVGARGENGGGGCCCWVTVVPSVNPFALLNCFSSVRGRTWTDRVGFGDASRPVMTSVCVRACIARRNTTRHSNFRFETRAVRMSPAGRFFESRVCAFSSSQGPSFPSGQHVRAVVRSLWKSLLEKG